MYSTTSVFSDLILVAAPACPARPLCLPLPLPVPWKADLGPGHWDLVSPGFLLGMSKGDGRVEGERGGHLKQVAVSPVLLLSVQLDLTRFRKLLPPFPCQSLTCPWWVSGNPLLPSSCPFIRLSSYFPAECVGGPLPGHQLIGPHFPPPAIQMVHLEKGPQGPIPNQSHRRARPAGLVEASPQ